MSWGIILTCIVSAFVLFFLGFFLCSVLIFFKKEDNCASAPDYLTVKLSDKTIYAKITAIEVTDLSDHTVLRIEGKDLRRLLAQLKKS